MDPNLLRQLANYETEKNASAERRQQIDAAKAIQREQKKIQQQQAELLKLAKQEQNKTKCPHCGGAIDRGYTTCKHCSQAVIWVGHFVGKPGQEEQLKEKLGKLQLAQRQRNKRKAEQKEQQEKHQKRMAWKEGVASIALASTDIMDSTNRMRLHKVLTFVLAAVTLVLLISLITYNPQTKFNWWLAKIIITVALFFAGLCTWAASSIVSDCKEYISGRTLELRVAELHYGNPANHPDNQSAN